MVQTHNIYAYTRSMPPADEHGLMSGPKIMG